jgi:hypothetical protein
VLVVVKNGNIKFAPERFFYLKATRRGEILKVDAAETVRDEFDGSHDFIDIIAFYAERKSVNTRKFLKQAAFALHYGHTCETADISESEYG